jgi:hypothetical protein
VKNAKTWQPGGKIYYQGSITEAGFTEENHVKHTTEKPVYGRDLNLFPPECKSRYIPLEALISSSYSSVKCLCSLIASLFTEMYRWKPASVFITVMLLIPTISYVLPNEPTTTSPE